MNRYRVSAFIIFFLIEVVFLGILVFSAPVEAQAGKEVMIIELEGPINPGIAMYVERGLDKAGKLDAALTIIRMDTPGGLGSSMRTIIKAIFRITSVYTYMIILRHI